MTYHCHRCGAALAADPPATCSACGYEMYLNPRPTGLVIIVDRPADPRVVAADGSGGMPRGGCAGGLRYLALMRAREPGAGGWSLPGGFCDGWESPAEAAVREAREELGVTVRLDRLVGMYIGEYQYQGERLPVLDVFWLASIVDGRLNVDSAEATGYGWLPLADPPGMAFSTMDSALRDAARLLAGDR